MNIASRTAVETRALNWLQRADVVEHRWCLRINRLAHRPHIRALFVGVSRLGDGGFWYALMLLLPLLYGERGLQLSLRMAMVGLVGLGLYKTLKQRLIRERPFITRAGVIAATPPLDRYSFPSGHTLHAVSFTVLLCVYLPIMAVLCVPFAMLVAASRVVLGLHYPTDVLAGAALGASLAWACCWLLPVTTTLAVL